MGDVSALAQIQKGFNSMGLGPKGSPLADAEKNTPWTGLAQQPAADPREAILQAAQRAEAESAPASVSPQGSPQAMPSAPARGAPAQPAMNPADIQAAAAADFAVGKYPSLLHALAAHGSGWAKLKLAGKAASQ